MFAASVLTVLSCAVSSAPGATGFALVVTNNRSLSSARPDLHYADDDGVQYATLFAEALGPERVTLLTELDPVSRELYPEWHARAQAPTRSNLDVAVARLGDDLQAAQQRGESPQLYLVFAGHGDVDHGQGYLELADSKLGARELDLAVLARLSAARTHLILDSCNSYFMLNPRKPGGKRFAVRDDTVGLLDKYPTLGAIISTSSEAVTYEWSELQSGIFSYELRSGLRGAADVNQDDKVSYAELAAFVETANQAVVNDLYRPKVFARGPKQNDNEALFARNVEHVRVVRLPATAARRLTVRNHLGVRVLDINKEAGTAATLALPAGDLELAEPIIGSDARPSLRYRRLDAAVTGTVNLDDLPEAMSITAQRGEAPVFNGLFGVPFGEQAYQAALATLQATSPEYYGITQRDAQVLREHLVATQQVAKDRRYSLLYGQLGGSLLAGMILGSYIEANQTMSRGERRAAIGALATIPVVAMVGWGAGSMVTSPYDDLVAEYDGEDQSTAAARGAAVLKLRQQFQAVAAKERRDRIRYGIIGGGLGLAMAGLSFAPDLINHRNPKPTSFAYAGVGLYFALAGLLIATADTQPAERVWQLYEATETGATAEPVAEPTAETTTSFSILPNVGVAQGTTFFGIGGTF